MFDHRAWYETNKTTLFEQTKARRKRIAPEIRGYILNYLLAHPCIDCGERDPVVLEFDHRPGEVKRFNLAQSIRKNFSLASIKTEIEKCDVRCANCHIRMTYKRAGRTHRDVSN